MIRIRRRRKSKAQNITKHIMVAVPAFLICMLAVSFDQNTLNEHM